jgi:hypothetical protein
MLNIQPKQWFQIISGTVSGLITGAALFQQLFGQDVALQLVAGLGVLNIVISSVGTALTGQAQLVKDVAAMTGVEPIRINEKANPTLAAVALDPVVDKVTPLHSDMDIITQTARGNN